MYFGHEKLDVYRLALEYVAWAFDFLEQVPSKHRNAKDQLLRASQSIPLNIAEGNGKTGDADRRRYFEIARGSAVECAAAQDILQICGALDETLNGQKKNILIRITAMLTRLGHRGYRVEEDEAEYGSGELDGAQVDALRESRKR